MKKVLGLILELNPFHNGHLYFINKAKEKVNPDITIAIISSSFTMRGELNLMDKFTRTNLLLENGVDIVLELPFALGCVSADYFALNSVRILSAFGVNNICCGVENDDINLLSSFAKLIDTPDFQNILKTNLDKGLSYSASCNKAIEELTFDINNANIFSMPNNTLCIQYLKAIEKLQANIKMTLVKRIANQYYDITTDDQNSFASASTIRQAVKMKQSFDKYLPASFYNHVYTNLDVIDYNLFNLLYQSCIHDDLSYTTKEGIENRIKNVVFSSKSFEEVVNKIVTKRYPANKVRRTLMHILLKDTNEYNDKDYYRVLGFKKNMKSYFNKLPIKKDIITTFKNIDDEIVKQELKTTKLYGLITKNYNLYLEEFKIPIIRDIQGDENE